MRTAPQRTHSAKRKPPNMKPEAWAMHLLGVKRCSCCKKTMPFSAFHRNRTVCGGIAHYCRKCKKVQMANMRERLADVPDQTAHDRFMSKVKKILSGCWIWRGALCPNGHGWFFYQGHSSMAHIAARRIFGMETPKHLVSYQTCGVPPCCNPEHVAFCTRRELSLHHSRANPFSTNARKALCSKRLHTLVDGVNILYVATGTAGKLHGVARACLDCWRAKFPSSQKQPNRREDAEAECERRLLAYLDRQIPPNLPKPMRAEVLHELLVRWKGRRVNTRTMPAVVRQIVRHERELDPSRAWAPPSLDAAVRDEDGERWIDRKADDSEWASDPAAMLERLEEDLA